MSRVLGEVKYILDYKWNKCIDELNAVRDATCLQIDIDMVIWELIADIKALPSWEDDQTKITRGYYDKIEGDGRGQKS